MWLHWLVFCDYGFSVSALWCPLATSTVLLGFLLPWSWGISSRLLQQSTATAPYLGWGASPHGRPSWPWTRSSSSQPSSPTQPPLLRGGVAPLSRRPWPQTWDSSSRPSCALAATAPGNSSRRRAWPPAWVAPPSRRPLQLRLPQNSKLLILKHRLWELCTTVKRKPVCCTTKIELPLFSYSMCFLIY